MDCRKRQEAESRRRRLQTASQWHASSVNGQAGSRAAEANGGDKHQDLCTVCIDKESDTVFQACGHLCVCEQCAMNLVRCPLCRTRSKTLRVFRA